MPSREDWVLAQAVVRFQKGFEQQARVQGVRASMLPVNSSVRAVLGRKKHVLQIVFNS